MTSHLKKSGSRAGTRDLSIIAQQVHAPRQPRIKQQNLVSIEEAQSQLQAADDSLLLAAGDQPGRSTFFDLDDSSAPRVKAGRKVHIVLERGRRCRTTEQGKASATAGAWSLCRQCLGRAFEKYLVQLMARTSHSLLLSLP